MEKREIIYPTLADLPPSGPIFLNSQGKPWTSNSIQLRIKFLREKLGLPRGIVAYSYRHTYTTTALVNGTDIATVAALLGHTSLDMVMRHYGHLDQKQDHLAEAAAKMQRRKE